MLSPGPFHARKAAYLGLLALFVVPLGGCGYVTSMTSGDAKPQYDASTGTNHAIITNAGRQTFVRPVLLPSRRSRTSRSA